MNEQNKEVRVRFAPSPTGYLHIGGARTAIYNWLYAKQHHGKFYLRIEDTDAVRSDEKMVHAIINGLHWLGLSWDDEIIFQSNRVKYYHKICQQLLRTGKAYYCYCKTDKDNDKNNFRYNGHCRELSEYRRQEYENCNSSKVIRFKVEKGVTSFQDIVHGSLEFNNDEIGDFVILRSDGMPTYHLAVVADDFDMHITHIIRGDDHLSNTPKQVMLYQAMNWSIPQFAHVPLILGSDKKRLSKRHGATSVEEYKSAGYYSKALFNYLVLLGWSPGNNKEIMSINELIDIFSLSTISKNSAIFDEMKLRWMNDQYISQLPDAELTGIIIPLLKQSSLLNEKNVDTPYVSRVVHLLKPKVKLFSDFINYGKYFFIDPEEYDEKAKTKYWGEISVIGLLQAFLTKMEKMKIFDAATFEENLRNLANESNISAAKLIHPIRLALTGFGVSPGIFELMEVLGKDLVKRRLQKAINYLSVNVQ